MDVPDEGVLDVDSLADDGSDEECEAQPSSGPASTPTSCASSPRGEEPASPHAAVSQTAFFHQTYTRPFFTSRRGPGRPRKEGVKLAREGKIVRRYRGNAGTLRGAKRHRTSRDDALDDMIEDDDFTMPAPEEPPYTPEKWPGKVCVLCNLSERSQLGQGEMKQITCNIEEDGNTTPATTSVPSTSTPTTPTNLPAGLASPPLEMIDANQQQALPLSRRQKSFNKCKTPLYNMEHTDELSIIGHLELLELPSLVSSGMLYIHRCCLEFSPPFHEEVAASSSDDNKELLEEARVRGIVTAALLRKCAFCQRQGASIPCKMSCSKYYHLPCVLASGGFMDFHTKSSFCKDHLYQAPLVCNADIDCRTCRTIGDMSNLMTCVICGGHYHGTCVGLAQLPGVRAGWSCRSCRVCQVCRGEAVGGAESRAVTCEHCDKLYHAMCLRPVMATVPKYGWKCKCCRVCSDCGSRSPGAGPSSRWHAHYTVCDSCYQQRNKGSCCPLCRRAYRAAAYRDMIRCIGCRRFVHGMCDPDADPQQYKQKKDQNPSYEYTCPLCKAHMQIASKPGSFEEDNMASTSQDSSFGDENSQEQDPLAIELKSDVGLGKGKPFTVSSKVAKKKIGGFKLKGGFPPAGKLGFQKRQRSVLEFGRKRGSKPKMRGVFGVPGLGLQRPQAPDNKTPEDDPGVENKLVLCSSKDKFVLTQDLCVMCGAIGTDSEGCLIACAQCGQTYHPYCVNIKVSQVIVSLGWRCLDCTVCEGCGSRGDEALLVLCDDCDTAWHTYCARPQLGDVPRGAWRCERCRRCLVCGTRDTQLWCDNYTECAPCASLVMCCVCSEPYSDGELIIQCVPCARWLHAACDNIRSEADAELCCRAGYKCGLCRGRDIPPPHLARAIEPANTTHNPASSAKPAGRLTALALGLAGEYYVDDVCLSQRGAHHMKQLEAELGVTHTRRKRRFKHENTEKDAEIMASIETVVQNTEVDAGDDSKTDTTAEIKEEPGLSANSNLKEGILWNVANDGPVPEGFTIYTTDSGLTVLRRKRQRNLNKLGIGGFVVRQRQNTKAQNDDEKEGDGTQNSGESPSNKRKPRRKPRSKLMEQFPSYMQEAFFGKDLLEPTKPAGEEGARSPELGALDNSDSDGEDVLAALCAYAERDVTACIALTLEEVEVLHSLKPKEEKDDSTNTTGLDGNIKIKTESTEDGQLKHTEDSTALKNAIMGPHHAEMDQTPTSSDGVATVSTKTEPNTDSAVTSQPAISPKDELSLLGVNLDAMVRDTLPDMDSNDVDEIFKGVLTDDSQESQESSVSYVNSMAGTPYSQQRQQLQSPMEYASPYHHTDFGSSGSSALSPLYSESGSGTNWAEQSSAPPPSYNQRSADKMRADESLGSAATISAVLYANTNHPEWKTEFPNWVDRCKQILKKWRALPAEQKAPYLQRARDNRSAIRMKKAQQSSSAPSVDSEPSNTPPAPTPAPPPAPAPTQGVAINAVNVTSVSNVSNVGVSNVSNVGVNNLSNIGVSSLSNVGVTNVGIGNVGVSNVGNVGNVSSVSVTSTVRAPNVTVTAGGLLEADSHIRVLTPSEIMRTLPRLANAPAPRHTDQERACNQQRSAREAEQERQWKQLQQMRQQQTQQQQQIIHDQRIQAMQRLRSDGSPPAGAVGPLPTTVLGAASAQPVNAPEAPRSAFPAQRFPLHYATADDNINRQLRELLQRHPEKMWPPQSHEEGEGAGFRLPLPVAAHALRPRTPALPLHRPDHQPQLIMHQRLMTPEGNQQQQNMGNVATQQNMEQKQNIQSQSSTPSGENKEDGGQDHGSDEMDIGDMDKLEQDPGNIGEVDILTGLGAEDDEKLLESLTAEIGEQFNILEYADPELAALHAADHLLDSLDLPDDHGHNTNMGRRNEGEQKSDNKMNNELQNAVRNIEKKSEIKSEIIEVKSEVVEMKTEVNTQASSQVFQDGVQRVITHSQQMALQSAMQAIKAEVKPETDDSKPEGEWQRPVFSQMFGVQQQQQGVSGARAQMAGGARSQLQFSSHHVHFAQGNSNITSANAASIVSAMTAQVQAALAAGRSIAPGTKLLGADGAVGVVRHDRSVLLTALPHSAGAGVARAAPPPYPGIRAMGASGPAPPPAPPHPQHAAHPSHPTHHAPSHQAHHQPPPPPYPQQMAYEMCEAWPDWLPRRPLLLQNVNQEQPLLLEELLEQEKREQEREGGDWGVSSVAGSMGASAVAAGAGVAVAPPPPSVPLYSGAPPPAPPPPPERPSSEADLHARHVYEQWLKNYNAYAADQLRYYEAEVQKLRKIRKSLNSKQRQLRKSGNELMPNDAAELQRVSTEQQALQKHLEAARKQARQHSMLMQEYETKQRQQNPQLAQQTVINQQQITTNQGAFNQNQNMGQSPQMQAQATINRSMQIGLQGSSLQQQQTLIRTQQTLLTSDGQPLQQQRIGLVTSPLNAQGRILQGGRTLVIEQTGAPQQQLVRQLPGVQERAQSVGGIVQFGQQQLRNAMPPGSQTPRPAGSRPAMSPLHVQSPHSQSPLHSIAPQSPLHHLTSPMQSPLHSQQSPLHHTSQSPLHSSTQSPLHTQQSPMHSQQSPMHVQATSHPQQSPMHPQQSPMHPQQSPIHQQSPMHTQNQMTAHSPMHPQQSPMHPQQSPMHPQHSPMHPQQSTMHPQQSPMHPQQSPMHPQQSPMHSQHSPMHIQQSPMHTQQSPMQSSMSPQHFLQQLQAQRTSPQLPTPSRSPQIYQQSQIQSPVTSHSPQLQNSDYGAGRFSRPAPGCSPLPTRFARPPQHQQGMRVGVPFGSRQQTSPLGSPQPLPSPGNTSNEIARQQMLQRQQYSPMGGAPASPSVSRSPHVARTPTPSASPAASPAPLHDHGGGHHHHMAPFPPGYRYFKPGLFGGAPWPPKDEERRRPAHVNKISILKRGSAPRPRFTGKTAAPDPQEEGETSDARKYVLYSSDVEYATDARMSFAKDDDLEHLVEHLDDDDIVVVEPGAISPEERIATEEDFEELIDSGKPEDEADEETPHDKTPTRTETTTKTVAVISLATAKQPSSNLQQYKLVNTSQNSTLSRLPVLSATVLSPHTNTKILNEVSQATVASVSIANQTISVPVLKNLSVPIGGVGGHSSGLPKAQIKKVPLNITNQQLNLTSQSLNKPMSSVISVISSNVPKGSCINPVITLATSNTISGQSRVPVTIMTQHQVKQKIVKTIEKPMALSLSNTKLSSLSVTHDATLPAKIFQDEAASPDSTVTSESSQEGQNPVSSTSQHNMMLSTISQESATKDTKPMSHLKDSNRDIDIENEISQQTELPHTLCLTDRTPLLLGKADIKSPDPIPEKIPDNIMEGDDEDKPEENLQSNLLLPYSKSSHEIPSVTDNKAEENVVKTIKAIANQTKEMVIDSNMQLSSDMAQESVQISIPSPTPSQERYLNDMTMREHSETVEGNPKHVESFEDMLCMLDNIGDDGKSFSAKQQQAKMNNPASVNNPNNPMNNPTPQQDTKETQEQPSFTSREQERLGIQSASVPQLSPLSQPAEMTSNMASVSQQLRTIMSSLNTSTAKVESQTVTRKIGEATTPTQVNYESLLPSSKVEVAASRPSPIQRIDKPPTSITGSMEPMPMSAAQAFGSRINTLSTMGQMRKSPTISPINSPVNMQSNLMKSPAQSPLVTNQTFNPNEDSNTSSMTSQIIQMPALSKIQSNLCSQQIIHSHNTITTSISSFQKSQVLPTSILGHTLLQPARQINTSNLQFNPQNISSSQPPALVMTSRSIMSNKEPAPNVTVRTHSIVNPVMSQMQVKQTQGPLNFITSSKLLHTQLTSPLKRSKSTDEPKSEVIVGHIQPTKRHSVESVIVKSEPMETDEATVLNPSDNSAIKSSQQSIANQRNDESQNVLLKQLLQTTTTSSNSVPQRTVTIQRTAPALGTIPSLEAQLARPSIPPATLSLTQEVEIPKNSPRHITSISQPFTSRSITSIPTSSMSPMLQSSTQSLMDVRKQPIKLLNKEDTTPIPECSPTMKTMPMYPMSVETQQMLQQQIIKKEVLPPQQSPVHRPFTPLDVKKELLDESSQQSATSGVSTASDQGKLDQPMKEEFPESVIMDNASEINPSETPSEAKKRKRREYQQKKRKQLQMNLKAAAENGIHSAAKKRPRKGSRYEEDYDTFIDNLMAQLRLLPPMQIQEPSLTTNFAVCPLFGSGDLTKIKNKDYDILKGDLVGEFGNAKIPNVADYYNTKPFGDEEPLPEKPAASTQRGFYDQEFQPILIEEDPEDKKLDFICKERDTDTPDTIVSCSSPEGFEVEPDDRFPGLKLIDDDEEDEDEDMLVSGRVSPVISLIAPIPIRVKPLSLYQLKDEDDSQKQLKSIDNDSLVKTKLEGSPGSAESNENVTVTLTLTSGAAEDILGVLKELAGILHIPPPTSYQIVERTATPPSHKLGLYRSKGKDGKEGAPIDIQSILNGAAKFCRHCDVVILDSVVRAKASEFPLLSANKGNAEEILCDSDSELYFCSAQCYERFAWRPTNIILDGKTKTPLKEDSKSDIETNLSKDRDDFDTASTESMETDDLDIKPDIKDEKMDLSFMDSLDNDELMKEVGDDVSALDEDLKSEQDDKSNQSVEKEKYKGIRYKLWAPGCIGPPVKYKRPTDRELTELVFRTGVAIMPVTNEDIRKCELCGIQGDGVADGVSRLLNSDVDRWVHLNCALWSEGVYETVSGALMNVDNAMAAGSNATCAVCRRLGATVRCFKVRCGSVYHLGCAVKDNCVFYKNKTAFCASHAPKNEKDNELTTLSVQRRVFISRDEQRQVASVMLHSDTNHLIRVGGLIFLSPGHLLPHQLAAFHTPNYIYPIGYKIVRFFWSMSRANSRCRYVCWISEEEGKPRFHVRVQDDSRQEMCAPTPRAAWAAVLDSVATLREGRNEDGVLKLWPNYVTGEDLFGLTEPAVVRVLESLPGIETLTDYRFKFGRSALLEGGLAVNPSGCARSEARCARVWRRPTRSFVPAQPPPAALDSPACPYSKQFVHTKSSQYKKMKLEWRNNVYLARSKIQGLGLYAARDLEKHTMVIEYIGEIIRSELSEIREKQYEARNRGIYMFRLDERRVVDATLCGGLARYINHSCQPNCVAETVEVDRHLRIIIFAKRRIARGEELAYDYKFDIEDDAHKIMCMCGAPNCRKWMN